MADNKKKKIQPPFVCGPIAGCIFIIRYYEDCEMHVFSCKDDKILNWTEKVPNKLKEQDNAP